MKAPNLLAANDYKRISKALEEHKEDTLTMTLGNYKLTVCVIPTGKDMDIWKQSHIITVEQWYRNVYTRKNCKTVAELRSYLLSYQKAVAKESEGV